MGRTRHAPSRDAWVVVCEQICNPPEVAVEGADALGAVQHSVPSEIAEGGLHQQRLAGPIPLVKLCDELLVPAEEGRGDQIPVLLCLTVMVLRLPDHKITLSATVGEEQHDSWDI